MNIPQADAQVDALLAQWSNHIALVAYDSATRQLMVVPAVTGAGPPPGFPERLGQLTIVWWPNIA